MLTKGLNARHAKLLSGPLQIAIDITNQCNFRCLHCYNSSGENVICHNEMSDKELKKAFSDFKKMKLRNICLCGGEPLLRYKLILELLEILDFQIPDISIVTNGYLLDEEKLEQMTKRGLTRIQISLDGCTAETYEHLRGVKGSFDRALHALELVGKNKDKVHELMISFCPTNFNIPDLPKVFEIAEKYKVDSVRVQPMMIIGRGLKNIDIIPKDYQYIQLMKYIYEGRKKYPFTIDWGDPSDHLIRFREYFGDIVTQINIQANGDIVASPYVPISFGNIKKHKLSTYWENGLVRLWDYPILQEYVKNCNCVEDIGKHIDGYPALWDEDNVMYDLIEEN